MVKVYFQICTFENLILKVHFSNVYLKGEFSNIKTASFDLKVALDDQRCWEVKEKNKFSLNRKETENRKKLV